MCLLNEGDNGLCPYIQFEETHFTRLDEGLLQFFLNHSSFYTQKCPQMSNNGFLLVSVVFGMGVDMLFHILEKCAVANTDGLRYKIICWPTNSHWDLRRVTAQFGLRLTTSGEGIGRYRETTPRGRIKFLGSWRKSTGVELANSGEITN